MGWVGGGLQGHPLCGYFGNGDVGEWRGTIFELLIPYLHIDPGISDRGSIKHEEVICPTLLAYSYINILYVYTSKKRKLAVYLYITF